jgi:hypothetical protein
MSTKLALTSGGGALVVDDVFASWLYTGTGAALNIQNGINLAAGGMVWTKGRNAAESHYLTDTVRGPGFAVSTDGTNIEANPTGGLSSFNVNGFSLGNGSGSVQNVLSRTYVAWSFRRARRFFDVVTYTGTGAVQNIPHALGIEPGFIIVRRRNANALPGVAYHRSAGAGNVLQFNAAAATASATAWNNTAPTANQFTVGADTTTNASGGTYVAFLFAHDPSADGIIQCGTFTGNSTTLPTVTLGWEPQFVITKANFTVDWFMTDAMHSGGLAYNNLASFSPSTSSAESTGAGSGQLAATATGFECRGTSNVYNANGTAMYYVAIRRPMKPPVSAASVFAPVTYVGNGGGGVGVSSVGFPLDLLLNRVPGSITAHFWFDRLRGTSQQFVTSQTGGASSTNTQDLTDLTMTGFAAGTNANSTLNSSATIVAYALRRARRFFDIVRYAGNGGASTLTLSHGLSVTPEMMIVMLGNNWAVYHAALGNTQFVFLNTTAAAATNSTYWNNTSPTSTQFTVGTAAAVNAASTSAHMAYFFATLAGISKVGSYTGNGTSQTIDCGFTTGARFVLAKRTSANGPATTTLCNGWNVADTARGISASAEPTSALNSTAADLTPNWLTPASSGFTVVQDSNNDMNVTGATYIYLAIA